MKHHHDYLHIKDASEIMKATVNTIAAKSMSVTTGWLRGLFNVEAVGIFLTSA